MVEFTTPPDTEECELKYNWIEKDEIIVQEWILKEIESDFLTKYYNVYNAFRKNISELRSTINRHLEYKKSIRDTCFNDKSQSQSLEKQMFDFIKEENHEDPYERITNSKLLTSPLKHPVKLIEELGLKGFFEKKYPNEYKEILDKGFQKISPYSNKTGYVPMSYALLTALSNFQFIKNSHQQVTKNNIMTMAYIYLHVLFDEFLLDTIHTIISVCPNILKNKHNEHPDKLTYAEIINAGSYEKIIEQLASEKRNIFGYEAYINKVDFLKKYAVDFTIPKEKWHDDAILFCEKRNALIHNSGKINEKNIKKLKEIKYSKKFPGIGSDVTPNSEILFESIELVEEIVNDIKNCVLKKFFKVSSE